MLWSSYWASVSYSYKFQWYNVRLQFTDYLFEFNWIYFSAKRIIYSRGTAEWKYGAKRRSTHKNRDLFSQGEFERECVKESSTGLPPLIMSLFYQGESEREFEEMRTIDQNGRVRHTFPMRTCRKLWGKRGPLNFTADQVNILSGGATGK